MPKVAISIPQLGEGLQEARLIRFLKQPGEKVRRDEPLYEMETDKAVTEVESPFEGTVHEWLVEEDSVHEIGAEIGTMEVEGEVAASPTASHGSGTDATAEAVTASETQSPASDTTEAASAPPASPAVPIPPRTRRYLKDKNLESVAHLIPAAGSRLTEEDVDRYLAQGGSSAAADETPEPYRETTLPSAQQTLNYRMARGVQVVIQAVLETDLDFTNIRAAREQTRESGGPTGFAMSLWCITQAMKKHDALRSSLAADGKVVRTYEHVNLGVAVSLPGDELKTAVTRHADTLSQSEFFAALATSIEAARAGTDQIDATTTVSVSNIGASDMRAGIPVIVAPAVATMAIGQVRPYPIPDGDGFTFQPRASLTMSFDHRLMNGVGASNFLTDVRDFIAGFQLEN